MRTFLLVAAGGLAGALILGFARLAALPPLPVVHHHANWAVWIHGERVDLSHDRYMEDVAACGASDHLQIAPENRVHMHENNQDVVHVHHGGATWGHLMQNIGWGLGADWIITDEGRVFNGSDGGELHFILNGFTVPPANNRVIEAGDRLLISYGTEDYGHLMYDRFTTVADDAESFDATFDPAGCSGHAEETFRERLRRAFWF
jgi:hypothetical protein